MVAGEVRNLAQRTSSSAKEIRELIDSSMQFIHKGSEQTEGVRYNLDRMNDAVNQVNDLINEISVAAREQSQGISQVHQAVNQMDDVTQQNAALVEEASAAALSLKEQAMSLSKLVSAFIISPRKTSENKKPVISPETSGQGHVYPSPGEAGRSDNNWQTFQERVPFKCRVVTVDKYFPVYSVICIRPAIRICVDSLNFMKRKDRANVNRLI
ncbi:methyl-accepting chemotaxis protein [Pantoea sp. BS_4]|uniref:methyl-accepting chemotaxis protein n=1 Tax=unclassified Pantoea TaxID=2630326 RepID=UPI0035C17254